MTTETFDDPAAFLAALHGKPRQKRGRATRPDLPAAGRAPSTGLTPLLVAGWNIEMRVGAGYRLYRGAQDTGWCASEGECCKAAKGMR
jgi:hypothetical protein